jgi:hypothetical protein
VVEERFRDLSTVIRPSGEQSRYNPTTCDENALVLALQSGNANA